MSSRHLVYHIIRRNVTAYLLELSEIDCLEQLSPHEEEMLEEYEAVDVGVAPDGRSLAACSSHSGRRFGRRVLLQVAAAHRCIRTADPVRCCCEDSKSELPLGR